MFCSHILGAEAGGPQVLDQLDCRVRPCLKRQLRDWTYTFFLEKGFHCLGLAVQELTL